MPLVVATLLVSLVTFAVCAGLVLQRETGFIDEPVLNGAVEHRAAVLDGPMKVVTHASKYPLLFVTVLGALVVSWRERAWRPLLLVGGTGALSVALATLAKETTDRHRPPSALWAIPEEGFCFPSRHTVIATAVLLILAYVIGERLASRAVRAALWCAALVCSVLVGASRVYLGVHWATDAFAGLALGASVALAVMTADGLVRARRRPPKPFITGTEHPPCR
ncbi:phosphatase PAP2 family protein [Streptomyces sp. NPDC048172]|uniref:phosphatase PAP2 family protein n=1 Tax=Streptomyces sp. NPDC048172 TaxID=3365505 RepID=UPI0037156DF9